jgi:hypothetical protein
MIAGIDFNTRNIDIVLLDEDTNNAEWHRFDVTEDALTGETTGDAFDRARRVKTALPTTNWWENKGVIAIGLEQPRGHHGITPLFRMQGAILACLPTRILVTPWNPSSWRLECGLKGNAPKKDVAWHALQQLVDQQGARWPQDAFDAYCIASATRNVITVAPFVCVIDESAGLADAAPP